jgi:hypothetical protein
MDHAPFVPLSEISQYCGGTLLRTVGYASSIDENQLLTIVYKSWSLKIDVSSLQSFCYRPQSVCQFIGELSIKDEERIMKPQLYRKMESLDVDKYHEVQIIKTSFFNRP